MTRFRKWPTRWTDGVGALKWRLWIPQRALRPARGVKACLRGSRVYLSPCFVDNPGVRRANLRVDHPGIDPENNGRALYVCLFVKRDWGRWRVVAIAFELI
jgi:hypothetical protein